MADPPTPRRLEAFIPHGSRCEADDGRGSDFGQCDNSASQKVTDARGRERYVCERHYRYWIRDNPPSR